MVKKEKTGKMIVVTAPSGSGKTTIVRHLLSQYAELAFSVSATNRKKRKHEKEGVDYYFMSTRRFKAKVRFGHFVEWEEVYPGNFYGTLYSEIKRIWKDSKHIIFDIDVEGAINIKRAYPEAFSIFIKPPSKKVLLKRLRARKTESEENIQIRIAKATEELTYEDRFDTVLVNDILEDTFAEAEHLTDNYLYPKSLLKKKSKKKKNTVK